MVYGSRQELETPREEYLAGGRPRNDLDRLRRVVDQLAEQARSTASSADDRPVLDDLWRTPRRPQPDRSGGREGRERARRGAARVAARRITERTRAAWQPSPADDRQPGRDRGYAGPGPQPGRGGRIEPPPSRGWGIERWL